jgi:hypothetical protein
MAGYAFAMRTVIAVGTVVLVGIGATVGDAAVVCQRRSGVMVVRDACRKKETVLDLAQFGAVGPKGEPGQQGAPGEPGTARAYATIDPDGTVVTKGGQFDLSVQKLGTGVYCVVVPAALNAINGTAVATLEHPGGTEIVSIGSRHGSVCNPLNTATDQVFPVYVRTPAGTAVDQGFLIVIP